MALVGMLPHCMLIGSMQESVDANYGQGSYMNLLKLSPSGAIKLAIILYVTNLTDVILS